MIGTGPTPWSIKAESPRSEVQERVASPPGAMTGGLAVKLTVGGGAFPTPIAGSANCAVMMTVSGIPAEIPGKCISGLLAARAPKIGERRAQREKDTREDRTHLSFIFSPPGDLQLQPFDPYLAWPELT